MFKEFFFLFILFVFFGERENGKTDIIDWLGGSVGESKRPPPVYPWKRVRLQTCKRDLFVNANSDL